MSPEERKVEQTEKQLESKLWQVLNISRISDEDENILKQCSSDSFYQRSIPYAATGCLLVYALRRGKHSVELLPYLGAAFGGWLVGKSTFGPICAKRIAESRSTSEYAKEIRQRIQKL